MALGLILYNVFVYLAFAVSGADVYRIWSSYYLFPPLALAFGAIPLNAGGVILWALGALAFFVVVFLGMAAVAKITIDRRSYAWIWTRRIVNWIRMEFWL